MKFFVGLLAVVGGLVVLLIVVSMGVGMFGAKTLLSSMQSSMLNLNLECPAAVTASNLPQLQQLAGGPALNVDQVINSLNQAATEPQIKIVSIKMGFDQLTEDQSQQLRDAVTVLQNQGKYVTATINFKCGGTNTSP